MQTRRVRKALKTDEGRTSRRQQVKALHRINSIRAETLEHRRTASEGNALAALLKHKRSGGPVIGP
jgi:hypothetical protein